MVFKVPSNPNHSITFCSLTFSSPTSEGPSERQGRVDRCFISIVSMAAVWRAHQYPFESLKCPWLRQSLPRVPRASGPVTMWGFCQSFCQAGFSLISCWDAPVTPEIQMGSAPLQLDGIRVHCAPGSAKALYSQGAGVPRPSDPHSPVNLSCTQLETGLL